MAELAKIWNAIIGDPVSLGFSVSIALLFVIAAYNHFKHSSLSASLDRSAPTLFTTIGVLGTFTGIFLGLLDFDVANIDKSVPLLLDGLKVAFVTSIVGMGAAILYKIVQTIAPNALNEGEATPEEILLTLRNIHKAQLEGSDAQTSALTKLREAISADGDSSLLTQLQKVRTTLHDGLDSLNQEFKSFAKTMAENNSKALIEALEHVIRDFNTQLNEQFGENFKQLNEAVGALLTWQENYKVHVEQLEQQFERALKGISDAEMSLSNIANQTGAIPEAMDKLKPILSGLEGQSEALQQHLSALAGLRDKALEAFPVIEGNLHKMTTEFSQHVSESIEQSANTIERQSQANKDLLAGYDDMRASAKETQKLFMDEMSKTLQNVEREISSSLKEYGAALEGANKEIQAQIANAWTKTEESINGQMNSLDQQMQDELSRALTTFSRNVASLSEKFVLDYGPLTDRLREVVRVAERVQ